MPHLNLISCRLIYHDAATGQHQTSDEKLLPPKALFLKSCQQALLRLHDFSNTRILSNSQILRQETNNSEL